MDILIPAEIAVATVPGRIGFSHSSLKEHQGASKETKRVERLS